MKQRNYGFRQASSAMAFRQAAIEQSFRVTSPEGERTSAGLGYLVTLEIPNNIWRDTADFLAFEHDGFPWGNEGE